MLLDFIQDPAEAEKALAIAGNIGKGIGAGLAGRSAEGIEYLKKGAKLATERATRYPRHPNSWADVNFVCDALGRSLEKSGDREGACRAMERCAEACETVLRLRPDAPFRSRAKIAYTSVRNLAKARGDAESEERATLALARLDAGVADASPGALLTYARRLLEVPEDRGRVIEALAVAKRAVKAGGSSEGLLVLALAYDAFGDEEAAVAALNKALARLAEEPDAVRRRLRKRIERRLELLTGRP